VSGRTGKHLLWSQIRPGLASLPARHGKEGRMGDRGSKTRMTRRSALALLAASAGGARAASGQTIAVIGAGLSGLSAARSLLANGHKVIVLEARDRIGGRIWTSRLWPDLPMDLGASWIHGVTDNPLTALADEAGAKRLSTSYDSAMALDASGEEIDLESQLERAAALVRKARKAADDREQDQSLADAISSSPQWKKATPAQRRLVRHHVNGSYEAEYGSDWRDASTWNIDSSKEFDGGDQLFPAGFDQITHHLARGLDVRLSQPVSRIDPTAHGVKITIRGGTILQVDRAVITIPLGVLQAGQLQFGETLARPRQNAIQSLRMGLLNKCWLRFDRIAWPDDVDWIEWLGPRDGSWAQWVSLARATSAPVLLGFHAGAQAKDMEALDNRAMAAAAHEALQQMFGNAFPAPIAAQVTRWSQDPLSLGSYSFNAVGTSAKTRRALAGEEWDGRLAFAGEATSADYFGTAHGAVLSGLAAVQSLQR